MNKEKDKVLEKLQKKGLDFESLRKRYKKTKKPIRFNFKKICQEIFGIYR